MKSLITIAFMLTATLYASAENYTIEEKVSQLLMISADTSDISKSSAAIKGCVGGLQLQWGSYSLNNTKDISDKLQSLALSANCKIPLFLAVDYEGGSVYAPTTLGLLRLPTNIMLGAANDESLSASLFYLAGKELKRAGINMIFGPVIDVNTNPKNPIIGIRSIGDDPELVSKIGKSLINGLKASGIIAVAKHFPGHGATVSDSHKTLPVLKISPKELNEIHLKPFDMAVKSKIPAIMTAHILYPAMDKKYPATLSKQILTNLLKEQLKFKGIVITDSMDMKAITSKRSIPKAAVRALKAGADLILIGKGDFDKAKAGILKALKNGKISEDRINDAFGKIFSCKKKYGLFKPQTKASPFDKAYVNISRELSQKAVTLVRNTANIIPLKNEIKKKKIAIILFSPQRFDRNTIALYKTLYQNGFDVKQYKFGISPGAKEVKQIMEYASRADMFILGSFQWAARQNKNQMRAIKQILKIGKPSVLISMMSPYDIGNFTNTNTIIATYGISETTMNAASNIIIGKLKPKGKLPVVLNPKK